MQQGGRGDGSRGGSANATEIGAWGTTSGQRPVEKRPDIFFSLCSLAHDGTLSLARLPARTIADSPMKLQLMARIGLCTVPRTKIPQLSNSDGGHLPSSAVLEGELGKGLTASTALTHTAGSALTPRRVTSGTRPHPGRQGSGERLDGTALRGSHRRPASPPGFRTTQKTCAVTSLPACLF
jgi:hypothetical protein